MTTKFEKHKAYPKYSFYQLSEKEKLQSYNLPNTPSIEQIYKKDFWSMMRFTQRKNMPEEYAIKSFFKSVTDLWKPDFKEQVTTQEEGP